MDRIQVQRGLKALAIAFVSFAIVYVVFIVGCVYGKIVALRSEANRVYPGLLTDTYERAMRGEASSLRGDPFFLDESATAFEKLDTEAGPLEAFQLDYVESQFLGELHFFTVRAKRKGEWRDEVWHAKRLRGFFLMYRAEGPGRASDSIVSPKSRTFPLHEKGKG